MEMHVSPVRADSTVPTPHQPRNTFLVQLAIVSDENQLLLNIFFSPGKQQILRNSYRSQNGKIIF